MYQRDPDDSKKSSPKALPASAFGSSITPTANKIYKRPWYVIVNGGNATTYNFLYETTCSVGGTTGETHTAGFDFASTTQIPTRLDINPVSWNGGGGSAGEVTFVYRGGL